MVAMMEEKAVMLVVVLLLLLLLLLLFLPLPLPLLPLLLLLLLLLLRGRVGVGAACSEAIPGTPCWPDSPLLRLLGALPWSFDVEIEVGRSF